MHEYGIAESILVVALEVANSHGRRPVEHVWVRLGSLQQIVPDALSFAFSALAHGTLAEGATLHCEAVAAIVRCRSCEAIFAPLEPWFLTCTNCGAVSPQVIAGEDLEVTRVTLREGEDEPYQNP
jgi:hydrogenase nickel incorporation protein HypA/HybF